KFVYFLGRQITGDGVRPLLLYAWNPLILIEAAGSGHNDVVMVTYALAGLLLFARGHPLLGLAVIVYSVPVKYLTGVLALLLLVYWASRQANWREAAAMVGRVGITGAAIIGALYLPFWRGPETVTGVISHGYDAPIVSLTRLVLREAVAALLTRLPGNEL